MVWFVRSSTTKWYAAERPSYTSEGLLVVRDADARLHPRPSAAPTETHSRWNCNGSYVQNPPKYAVTSFLVDGGGYAIGATILGHSLSGKWGALDVGMYLLLLNTTVLTNSEVSMLHNAGWEFCIVPLIEPVDVAVVFPRFRQQFTKLVLFAWIEFTRVVYLDSDTLVLGDISLMFEIDPSDEFAACPDYESGHSIEEFNMGVFSLTPSTDTFAEFLHQAHTRTDYRLDTAEQGMLRDIYRKRGWLRLPLSYNGPLGMYMFERQKWHEEKAKGLRVIHYTEVKPFNLSPGAAEWSWEPMQTWKAALDTLDV
jgi:hypothetical protein